MARHKAGYEVSLKYGTAGSSASGGTELSEAYDISVNMQPTFAKTTTKGAGTAVPTATHQPVEYDPQLTFSVRHSDSASFTALHAAATNTTPTPVALYCLDHSGGTVLYDGDCYLQLANSNPTADGQEYSYTTYNTQENRAASY